jgi:hypothetical protein
MWTPAGFATAIVFWAFAVIGAVLGVPNAGPMWWSVIGTYFLTGLVCILIGVLADLRADYNRPEEIEVLLRYQGHAWVLTVLRNRTGELYAPSRADKRTLKPVDLAKVPHTILGCPRFIPLYKSEKYPQFNVLGELYY